MGDLFTEHGVPHIDHTLLSSVDDLKDPAVLAKLKALQYPVFAKVKMMWSYVTLCCVNMLCIERAV
jgi:hypothetical protein